MKIQKDAGLPYYLSFHHFALGLVQAASGKVSQSKESFKTALALSHNHNERWIEGASRIYLGITMARNDELKIETAEESILEGIQILEDRKIKPWSSIGYYILSMLQVHRGEIGQARVHLNNAEKMFKQMGMDYWLELIRQSRALSDG
jgi:ATP/maltotriose-dependent transcriptional regulator MalT